MANLDKISELQACLDKKTEMNISELRTITATREHHYRNAVTLLQYFGNIITTKL